MNCGAGGGKRRGMAEDGSGDGSGVAGERGIMAMVTLAADIEG